MNKAIAEFIPDSAQPVYSYTNTNNSNEFVVVVIFLVVLVLLVWLVIKFVLPRMSHYLGYLVREFEKGKNNEKHTYSDGE